MPEPRQPAFAARHFWILLAVIIAVGACVRVGYLVGWKRDAEPCSIFPPEQLCGDAVVYHEGARLLVDGKGFIRPIDYEVTGRVVHSADHPPLFLLYLSAFTLVGLGGVVEHQLACVALGSVTVGLVGVLGRRMGSARVGLIAAFFTATYALIWVNDLLVMSETIAMTMTVALLLAAHHFWTRPSTRAAVALGAIGGLLSLARAELAIDLPLIALPLVWWVVAGGRARARALATIFSAAAVVVAPWVARNLYQFQRPVLLSTGLGIALAYSNCDRVYYGERIGYWEYTCGQPPPPAADASIEEARYREQALRYIGDHERRLPIVITARVLRQWSFFHPDQQTALDVYEGRDRWVSRLGLAQYYGLLPLGVVGLFALRRRSVPTWPLVALFAGVTITAVVTYGVTRFRAPAEIGLVVLAAFGVDAVVRAAAHERDYAQLPGGSS